MAFTVMDTTTLQARNYTTTWDATGCHRNVLRSPAMSLPLRSPGKCLPGGGSDLRVGVAKQRRLRHGPAPAVADDGKPDQDVGVSREAVGKTARALRMLENRESDHPREPP